MSLNSRVIEALAPLKLQITVAENPVKQRDKFIVIIPIADNLGNHADNKPGAQIEEAELALYVKGNYLDLRDRITKLLIEADILISGRRYIEYETNTKYHHYVFNVMVVNLL